MAKSIKDIIAKSAWACIESRADEIASGLADRAAGGDLAALDRLIGFAAWYEEGRPEFCDHSPDKRRELQPLTMGAPKLEHCACGAEFIDGNLRE